MDIGLIVELLSRRRQLRAQERWTRRQLDTNQAQWLRLLREYAYAHSPFYQQFHKGVYEAPLEQLPVLEALRVSERPFRPGRADAVDPL